MIDYPLSLVTLVESLKEVMRDAPDKRTGKHCVYSLEDAAVAAFAVFYTQSPSFLAHQRTMEQTRGQSNAQTLFGMSPIPTDNCVRTMLDPVAPPHLFPLFTQIFKALNAGGHIDPFRVPLDSSASGKGALLIALDGTAYHASHTIHCAQCARIEHQNGSVSYQHTVITPVIVTPGLSRVIPLAPEFMVPQDYETAAAPHFLFVCQPSSHLTLYAAVEGLARSGGVTTHEITRRRGQKTSTDTSALLRNCRYEQARTRFMSTGRNSPPPMPRAKRLTTMPGSRGMRSTQVTQRPSRQPPGRAGASRTAPTTP